MTRSVTTAATGSPISTITTRSSSKPIKNSAFNLPTPVLVLPAPLSSQHSSLDSPFSAISPVSRRNVIALSIGGVLLGFNGGEKNAWAAARRPPPPPTEEKKDPNVSGVLAKVLASKKRKEAMKEAMAKQRGRGKKVEE